MGFLWSYSHEYLLPRELSQQQVLVKSQIPTLDQMSKIDKEAEIKRSIEEKNRAGSEWKNIIKIEDAEESSSSSSMSMYSIDSYQEDSEVPSHRTPTLIEAQLLENQEVHSSPTMEKILSERHSVIHEEENHLSYNIEEIFEAFTFNIYKKEITRKRV